MGFQCSCSIGADNGCLLVGRPGFQAENAGGGYSDRRQITHSPNLRLRIVCGLYWVDLIQAQGESTECPNCSRRRVLTLWFGIRTADKKLKRTLGPWSLIAFGIGAVIGSGIFTLTGTAAAGQTFEVHSLLTLR